MPTEFMHAMYDQGGGAGLRDFWDRWMTNPMFAGGFIWVFCDEAPKRSDRGGVLGFGRIECSRWCCGTTQGKGRKFLCHTFPVVAGTDKTLAYNRTFRWKLFRLE